MSDTEVKKVRYECDICGKDYAKSNDMKFHVKWVHDGDKSKESTCKICGNSFSKKKNYDCRFCNKLFATPIRLSGHINKMHVVGNKKKKRDICGKEFSKLESHIYFVHTKKDKLECKFCKNMFASRVSLRIHTKNFHEKDKNFICEICDKEFKCQSDLTQHKERHHAENFKCDTCERSFTVKTNLN